MTEDAGTPIRPSGRPDLLPRTGWTAPLTALISAAMAFLGVLTVAAALAAGNLASAWRTDLAGVATVRVSAIGGDVEDRVKAVVDVLRTTPGITGARPLSDAEQAALVAPWLGDAPVLGDLPTPRLIDVSIDGDGPDVAALQERLNLTVNGAVYDDHASWRGPLVAAADALETVALSATVLVLLTSIAMVAFAARATLVANRDVIHTVRLIGAEDSFLAGAFVKGLTRRAVIGGLGGSILGCLVLITLPEIEVDAGLAEVLSPGWAGWLVMALGVPLLGAVAAWFTARWAVQAVLGQIR